MKSVKVIVLDADNCIFLDERTREGSEEIKDRTWFDVFAEYEHDELAVVLEQAKRDIAGGKGDRGDVARRVLERFAFPAESIANEVARRCDQFEAIVQKQIEMLAISPLVRETLETLSRRFPLYLNTATPEESITKTLAVLQLEFFKGVHGRPGTKIDNLRAIISAENVHSEDVLFVGDAQSDLEAAREVGCRFIGIRTKRNTAWNDPQSFEIIDSLGELEAHI